MTVSTGDIVEVTAHRAAFRWTVIGSVGSPRGEPRYVRIVRRQGKGTTGLLLYPQSLTLIESPAFAIGDKVSVNGKTGEIIALGDDQIRVRLDPFTRPLTGGGALEYVNNETEVPRWQLVLENRLS